MACQHYKYTSTKSNQYNRPARLLREGNLLKMPVMPPGGNAQYSHPVFAFLIHARNGENARGNKQHSHMLEGPGRRRARPKKGQAEVYCGGGGKKEQRIAFPGSLGCASMHQGSQLMKDIDWL